MMPDNHYIHPRLAQVYDLDCGWSEDRSFCLSLVGTNPVNILDLGCGTGLLCDAYAAQGHIVTGVDPAPAMLDVARQKPHGNSVDWVPSSAQDYRSDRRFDLIIMTGNAFQVFLEYADVLAVFKTMQHYLKPEGRAVFETRNPALKWHELFNGTGHVPGSHSYTRNCVGPMKNGRISFESIYDFGDEVLRSFSTLRFMTEQEITSALAQSGLAAEALYGDWQREPFVPASQEMVFTLRRTSSA